MLVGAVSLCDDLINYAVLVKPFAYFQPHLFHDLIRVKDVGSSLGLATLIGLQLCQFRKIREPLFALALLGLIMGFAFTSVQLSIFVTNLNHILFLVLGFLIGKAKFEYARRKNSLASKGKAPKSRLASSSPPSVEKAA